MTEEEEKVIPEETRADRTVGTKEPLMLTSLFSLLSTTGTKIQIIINTDSTINQLTVADSEKLFTKVIFK